jgi:hypothetical protein
MKILKTDPKISNSKAQNGLEFMIFGFTPERRA